MSAKRKTWQGRVFLGRDQEGEQIYYWVGRFKTKRERDDAVARAKVERPWEQEPEPEGLTCNEWADRFLARMELGALRTKSGRRFKDSSIDTARTALKPFRAEFGERTPGSITRVEAEDWAARVAPSKLPIVITLMNDLYRAEEIDRNRFEGLSRRGEGRRDKRPPSEEEMVLLLDGCSALGDYYAPMMRALITFGAYTLMRPSELVELDWERDLHLKLGANGRVHVQRRFYRGGVDLPKSNKTRIVTLVPPARAALDSLLEVPGYYPAGLVFRNKTGGRLTPPTMTAYWKEVRARARIDVDFYTATKHFGVWYLKVVRGLPDAAIAAQAGWSERSVTKMVETYGHAVDERRLDEIDAAFAEATEIEA
jgi:integrase